MPLYIVFVCFLARACPVDCCMCCCMNCCWLNFYCPTLDPLVLSIDLLRRPLTFSIDLWLDIWATACCDWSSRSCIYFCW